MAPMIGVASVKRLNATVVVAVVLVILVAVDVVVGHVLQLCGHCVATYAGYSTQ